MTGTKTWSLEGDDSVCRESPYLLGQVEGVWEAEGRLLVVVVDVVVELGVARVAGRTRHDDEEGAGRLHVPRPPVGVIRPCKGNNECQQHGNALSQRSSSLSLLLQWSFYPTVSA